jgi:hypothetical protein
MALLRPGAIDRSATPGRPVNIASVPAITTAELSLYVV